MKKIILSFLFILICSSILPQTINIEGNTYYKNEGYWYLENANGHDFLVNDKVISIKFRNEINMDDGLKSMESQGVFLKEIRRNRLGYIDLEVPSSINLIDLYNQLKSNQSIKAVGINTYSTYNYNANDPQISQQWHINKIKANFGWDYSGGEDCIIIAILDSGSEWTHEDIGIGLDNYQNIWLNQNEDPWSDPNDPTTGNHFDNDGNGYIDDWKGWDFDFNNNDSRGIIGHGTNVTGIAGAKTDNNRGVAGVAGGLNHNGVQLMILNVGNITPNGAVLDDAIIYAVDNGADIIQMSLGVAWSQAIEAAIDDAYNNHNVLLVCASGNDSSSTVNFPSSDQNVIGKHSVCHIFC